MKRFILAVEGPNLQDIEVVELPWPPKVGDPIETRYGTCLVASVETMPDDATYAGKISCRLP